MMKEKFKGLLVGLTIGLSITVIGVSAANGSILKELWYNNIKITLDGKNNLQIVTNAKNIQVGDIVPVALDGADLCGGLHIKKGEIRGVSSDGIVAPVCSIPPYWKPGNMMISYLANG